MSQGGACGTEGGDGEDSIWDVEGGEGWGIRGWRGRNQRLWSWTSCGGGCGLVMVLVGGWHNSKTT